MGSIPLPALSVRPPQTPDPLEGMGRILALRNAVQQGKMQEQSLVAAQQENQMRDTQMKDQQAMTQAMHEWDGKDLDALPPLVIKNGGSANAVMGLKSKMLDMKSKFADLAKTDAETNSKNLDTQLKQNDQIAGALGTTASLADADLPKGILDTAQKYFGNDPQHMQAAQALAQQAATDPESVRNQLKVIQKSFMGQSALMKQATDESELALRKAQERDANANAAQKEVETQYGGTGPVADAKYRFLQSRKAQGGAWTPEEAAFVKGYEKQKLLVPATTAQIRVEGFGKIRQFPVYDSQTKQTVYMDSNEINDAKLREPGRYTVPSYSPEALGQKDTTNYFTKGKGGQQLTAFNTAMVHLDTLDRLAADLNNTDVQVVNRAKQAWAEQTGNPAPANFAAAKNAMSGEVAAALKASGATDQEIAHVGATFDKAQSPAQLKGAINTYRELLRGKRDQLQKQYEAGMQGKPNFGQGGGGGNATKILSMSQIQKAAQDHGVSVDEAKRQAQAQGYQVQ